MHMQRVHEFVNKSLDQRLSLEKHEFKAVAEHQQGCSAVLGGQHELLG